MTRIEKMELLNKLLELEEKNDIGNLTSSDRAEFQMWVKGALEQESCENKEIYNKGYADGQKALYEHLELCKEEQEPKTGHWIKEKSIYGWDGHSYQCSVCGRSIHLDVVMEVLADYPYCHCGARMIEPQKSEDKG